MGHHRYRSKPSEVEAIQWLGENFDDVQAFGADVRLVDGALFLRAGVDGAQGPVAVPVGHWIVRAADVLNDYWPVEHAYFAAKYQRISEHADAVNHDYWDLG